MKNKTNTSLILLTFIAVGAIGVFFYGISYIKSLSEKTSVLRSEVQEKQIKIQNIQDVNKIAEKTAEDRLKIMNYFVRPDGSIDFVSELESVASSFSLKYNTNSIDNTNTEALTAQGKDLLKISMTLSGGWKNILRFLTYIETLPYAVRVEKAEFVSEGVVLTGDTSASSDETTAKVETRESTWKLSLVFSVVKIKETK